MPSRNFGISRRCFEFIWIFVIWRRETRRFESELFRTIRKLRRNRMSVRRIFRFRMRAFRCPALASTFSWDSSLGRLNHRCFLFRLIRRTICTARLSLIWRFCGEDRHRGGRPFGFAQGKKAGGSVFRLGSSRFGLEDPPLLDSLDVTRFCGVYLDFVAVAYEWGDVYYQAGF